MKDNRELFEKEFRKLSHTFNESLCVMPNTDRYYSKIAQVAWEAWQASANREGYKLVPVDMSWDKADELASAEWDKNKTLFKSQCTNLSVVQVEQFRLRWCKNKAHQTMSDYKKVVSAVK